jgi:DNA-binding transcriptional MocR family regulator
MKRYEQLTAQLAALVRDGTLRAGDRAPSVREASRDHGASPGTVVRAYELLQARGYLEARARSGFYVSSAWRAADSQPRVSHPNRYAAQPDVSQLVFEVLETMRTPELVPLGSAFPGADLFPMRQLGRDLGHVARHLEPASLVQDLPPGNDALRRQIARRYRLAGAAVAAEEIVITSGAMEGLNLALQVVTRPNDIVAVESPAFYGCLQAIERLGRRALEVPTHPQHGVAVDELENLLRQHDVRACWLMTSLQNPLGATLPDAERRRLVKLLAARNIPLIEDNVYAELGFGRRRPQSAKVFDTAGSVLDCGSFSKCLSPGYRVGWVAAGRFAPELWRSKIISSLATTIPVQAALARYLARGHYERHLRALRRELARRQRLFVTSMERHFPPGTRWTRPEGGYLLWVEMPPGVDAIELHRAALGRGISVAPGPIFSARQDYRHSIRLNYGHPWTTRIESAVRTIGGLIRERL